MYVKSQLQKSVWHRFNTSQFTLWNHFNFWKKITHKKKVHLSSPKQKTPVPHFTWLLFVRRVNNGPLIQNAYWPSKFAVLYSSILASTLFDLTVKCCVGWTSTTPPHCQVYHLLFKTTALNRLLQLFRATQVTQANTNYAPAITHHNTAVHWATIINAFMDGLTRVKLTSTEY